MTFGESFIFALIWQKLRGIEKNTKTASAAKPKSRLTERKADGVPSAVITALMIIIFSLVVAFIVCLMFAAFIPAIIVAIVCCAIIRIACFTKTENLD